jgi:hypothetical protein
VTGRSPELIVLNVFGFTDAPLLGSPFPAAEVMLVAAAGGAPMPAASAVGMPATGVLTGSLCFAQAAAAVMHNANFADW